MLSKQKTIMSTAGQLPSSTADAVLKPSSKSYCADLTPVRGYTFEDATTGEPRLDYELLLSSFLGTGFQATQLANAIKIVNEMLVSRQQTFQPDTKIEDEFIRPRTGCTIFLAYTSNMISSGIREHIRFLVKNKLVDCIVTTAGGIEEDLIKCLELSHQINRERADTFVGSFRLAGSSLREHGINRIGNLLVPNDNYCRFEDWLLPILDKMLEEQKASQGQLVWSPSKLIERLGLELDHPDSVCYWAAKNKIPIFCPALTDGSLGDMLHFHTFKSPGLILDLVSDIRRINTFAHNTESSKTGAIILGGGVAKHHTMNANLMRNGANYTVFINTAAEYDGSDSGAEPDEAVSWGKSRNLSSNTPRAHEEIKSNESSSCHEDTDRVCLRDSVLAHTEDSSESKQYCMKRFAQAPECRIEWQNKVTAAERLKSQHLLPTCETRSCYYWISAAEPNCVNCNSANWRRRDKDFQDRYWYTAPLPVINGLAEISMRR